MRHHHICNVLNERMVFDCLIYSSGCGEPVGTTTSPIHNCSAVIVNEGVTTVFLGLRPLFLHHIMVAMLHHRNSAIPRGIFGHKPECWLESLVCPRRYLAVLPSSTRPNL